MGRNRKKIALIILSCILVNFSQGQNKSATGNAPDFLDSLAALLMILFILTLISERIANFFKLRLSDTRGRIPKSNWKYRFTFRNTALKSKNQKEEKKREYRVMKINLFFGVLVALTFRADLFMIVHHISDPSSHIGWDKFNSDWSPPANWDKNETIGYYIVSILITFVGCFLVGVFLSFGSKFWHDLLDLVLQIKDYRRSLAEVTAGVVTKKFSELEVAKQYEIIAAAIKENYTLWKAKYSNINACEKGLKYFSDNSTPVPAIIFYVTEKLQPNNLSADETIPVQILYQGYYIPTDIQQKKTAIAHAGIVNAGDNYDPSRIGTNVSRANNNVYGTVGLKVKQTHSNGVVNYFLLSCFHVLYPERIDPKVLGNSKSIQVKTANEDQSTQVNIPGYQYCNSSTPPSKTMLTAYCSEGVFSNVMDAAIAKLANGEDLSNTTFYISDNKSITIQPDFTLDDMFEGMDVVAYGCVSSDKSGKIKKLDADSVDVMVDSPSGSFLHTFNNLIRTDAISAEGDSGAPVLSKNGNVIGIIIAGDGANSYVLPFQFVKNTLFVSI